MDLKRPLLTVIAYNNTYRGGVSLARIKNVSSSDIFDGIGSCILGL